jgi:uncharacterized protein
MKPLVIYHGNCADGFTAAWLFNRWFGEQHPRIAGSWPQEWIVDHHAGFYGDNPPDVTDRDVFILDFSYPPAMVSAMALSAASITIIDHHESAIRRFMETGWVCPDNVHMTLDTTRSGAYLTAKHLWPGKDPDEMVKLVDDRDRWVFHMPDTRNFNAGLFSRHYTIEDWNAIAHDVQGTINDGAAIERKHFKDIKEMLGQTAVWRIHEGQPILVANLPYIYSSDAGHMMIEQNPGAYFAACYYINNKDEYVFSLRSDDSRANVSKIAEQFGGGGHRNAAGFKVKSFPFDEAA